MQGKQANRRGKSNTVTRHATTAAAQKSLNSGLELPSLGGLLYSTGMPDTVDGHCIETQGEPTMKKSTFLALAVVVVAAIGFTLIHNQNQTTTSGQQTVTAQTTEQYPAAATPSNTTTNNATENTAPSTQIQPANNTAKSA